MKKNTIKSFKDIINFCIENKADTFSEEKFSSLTFSDKSDYFIFDQKSKTYKLDLLNGNGGSELLSIAEEKLNKKLPLEINDALIFALEFENEIKKPTLNVSWTGIFEIKESLICHILIIFQNEMQFDVIDFYKKSLEKEYPKPKHLVLFDTYFFRALLFFNLELSTIIEFIKFSISKERISTNIL